MAYRCAVCQSERVIPGATIFDQGQHSDGVLRVGIATNPEAMLFKGMHFTTLRAIICGECGHMQLAVENPGERALSATTKRRSIITSAYLARG